MNRVGARRAAGALAALAAVTAGCTASPPDVDPELRKAVQPAVHDALVAEASKDGGLLGDSPSSKARWFCAEKIVEIRKSEAGALTVGLVADCSELEGRAGSLVQGTGMSGPHLMKLAPTPQGAYRVTHHDAPPDGAGYDAWIGRSFSKAAAAEIRRAAWNGTPTTESAARTHFGLPADAPVTSG
ncbi:hypothetical protein AB0M39_39890 [Streptomyces sp. NPDC051907]|uniref:hypothetical protein n=1 Tax=Streptomyces sp. NPDC051907 TaxID=3155284 RepID=UPI00341814D1